MTAVIHIITALERGGAQRNTLETAARLNVPGRPQLLVTGQPAALDAEAAERLGPRLRRLRDLVTPVSPARDVAAALSLVRLLERQVQRLGAPVLVHTHSSKAGILGRLAARAVPGTVVVHTVHGFGMEALGAQHRWILEAAERVAAPAADFMIFVSDADRRTAERMGLLGPQTRAVTIRSGIDPTALSGLRFDDGRRARARSSWGIPDDVPLAVTVGNLKPQKNPLFHVDVLAAWRSRCPDARLVFLGDGPLRAAVEARAAALGVGDALLLPGFLDDIADALAAADVFLLASAWEGLPRSALEAIAAGLPCVVRDAGWASDLAWAQRVVPLPITATAGAFAEALHRVVTHPDAGPKPARLPRAFTLEGMLAELSQLYDELIGVPRARGRERRRARRQR